MKLSKTRGLRLIGGLIAQMEMMRAQGTVGMAVGMGKKKQR